MTDPIFWDLVYLYFKKDYEFHTYKLRNLMLAKSSP